MGHLYKQKGSKNWFMQYFRDGKRYRESTRTDNKPLASKRLKKRDGEIAEGKFPGLKAIQTKIDDLVELYIDDFESNNRKSIREAYHFRDLILENFGGKKASHITSKDIKDYRKKRREEGEKGRGIQDSTVNRELGALRRMYNLGMRQDPPLVSRVPNIQFIKENNIRTGFFEHDEYLSLRGASPDHLKVIITIAYYTGMRAGEILNLQWDHMDWEQDMICLDPGSTKNNEGRMIPIPMELKEVLERWWKQTKDKYPSCNWICHYKGEKYTYYKRAWKTACKLVGLEGKLLHDFRRSAIRNFVRAGVPQAVAKDISGHLTDSIFNRYNIVSVQDKREAAKKYSAYINSKKEVLEEA